MTLCHILPERRGWVNRISTTVLLHHLDSNKSLGEKAKWETTPALFWTNPESNTLQYFSCSATYFPSHKPSKKDEQNVQVFYEFFQLTLMFCFSKNKFSILTDWKITWKKIVVLFSSKSTYKGLLRILDCFNFYPPP